MATLPGPSDRLARARACASASDSAPAAHLLDLDADTLRHCFCALSGTPPDQAASLAQAASTCKDFQRIVEDAAAALLATHLALVHDAYLELQSRYKHALPALRRTVPPGGVLPTCLNLPTGPAVDVRATAEGSALRALWGEIPQLPLSWTLLTGSMTKLEANETGWITALEGALDAKSAPRLLL